MTNFTAVLVERLKAIEASADERAANLSEAAMECSGTGEKALEKAYMEGVSSLNRTINDIRAIRSAFTAALAAAPVAPGTPQGEFAWLIERVDLPDASAGRGYWTGRSGLLAWSEDHNAAIRFARKNDADAMIRLHSVVGTAVEHGWAVPPATEGGTPGSDVLCEVCAGTFCPHKDRLHFDKDGCPSCEPPPLDPVAAFDELYGIDVEPVAAPALHGETELPLHLACHVHLSKGEHWCRCPHVRSGALPAPALHGETLVEKLHTIFHEFIGTTCRTDGGWCDARDHAEGAAELVSAPVPTLPTCDPSTQITLHEHVAAVGRFLNELYAIMVDPVAEGTITVAEMQVQLLMSATLARNSLQARKPAVPTLTEQDNHHNALACPYCNPQRLSIAALIEPALREKAEAFALELWTNSRSIYSAEVGNTRRREATAAAIDYIAVSIVQFVHSLASEGTK